MAGLKIDLDDGILYEVPVERRPAGGVVHRRDPETGAEVFMYKRRPGTYYSANGIEVSPVMAKRSGFDTERLAKEKAKLEKMASFEAEYSKALASNTRTVVKERNGIRLVDLGGNRFIVEDDEGQLMTKHQASTIQQGMDWFENFAGPEVENELHPANGSGQSGADRRPEPNGRPSGYVRKSVDPKAPVPA